jgi:hypothetical protein
VLPYTEQLVARAQFAIADYVLQRARRDAARNNDSN